MGQMTDIPTAMESLQIRIQFAKWDRIFTSWRSKHPPSLHWGEGPLRNCSLSLTPNARNACSWEVLFETERAVINSNKLLVKVRILTIIQSYIVLSMQKKAVKKPIETYFYWGWKGQFEEARKSESELNSKGKCFSFKNISRTYDFYQH